MKRIFDILFSGIFLILLLPVFLIISLLIIFDSKGGIFFKQLRVGMNSQEFWLLKFRSMRTGAERSGLLTVGSNDSRVTRVGYYLRKYKLDELPQLINILSGEMSIVGPRPEVRKYVELYNNEQLKVLTVRPGLTDLASIAYIKENELLTQSNEPEILYINEIMPDKLKLNLKYIETRSFLKDIFIILKTMKKIFF